jgi:hypothetical protein
VRNLADKKLYDYNYIRRPYVMEKDRIRQRGRVAYKRGIDRMKLYGLTNARYEELLRLQHNRCGICGKHQIELYHTLAVDHDHETGKVRGLLCTTCNVRLGVLENKAFAMVAEVYLDGIK